LVLPSEEDQQRWPWVEDVEWEAAAIAAAVTQVRPPEEVLHRPAANPSDWRKSGGGGSAATRERSAAELGAELDEEGVLTFPELEDVELELELQMGSGAAGVRRFSVVGVRLRHVIGVVAQPAVGSSSAAGCTQAGSLSRVRHLLRPSLAPMSSLFHVLAHWVPQQTVAAHNLLVRLLE
ncbi:hypothetical protein Agub_g231, partial [Astrephomene gubernaculifera]